MRKSNNIHTFVEMIEKYSSQRGDPVEIIKKGVKKRRGVIEVLNQQGEVVKYFPYVIRNYFSLANARIEAERWIKERQK